MLQQFIADSIYKKVNVKSLIACLAFLLNNFLFFQAKVHAQASTNRSEYFSNQLKKVNDLKNSNPDSAYKITDRLIKDARAEKQFLFEAKFLLVQGVNLYLLEKNKDAEVFYRRSLTIFQELKDSGGIARAYNNLGILSREANDIDKALYYQNRAADIRLASRDPLLSSSYNNIAVIYFNQGNYPKALENYFKGLTVAERASDKLTQSSILNNIGLIYWKQLRYNDAFKCFQQCLELEKERGYTIGIAGSYNNMGGIMMDQDRFEEASKYFKLAISYAEKISSNKEASKAITNLGHIEYKKKNYQKALDYLLPALEMKRKLSDNREIVRTIATLGEVYADLPDFDKAEKILNEGLSLAQNTKLLKEKESIFRVLSKMYAKKGDWERANQYFTLRDSAKDSLFTESNSKIIFDLQTKYETAKKEKQIDLLNKDNRIKSLDLLNRQLQLDKSNAFIKQQDQQLTINQLELTNKNQLLANQQLDAEKKTQNIKSLEKQSRIQKLELQNKNLEVKQRNLAIGSLLMAFIAVGAISFSYYKRNKLKQKNLLQAEIYKQQEIATRSVFEGEQNERIRIARDLHDGIGQMLSVVKMNVSTLNPDDKTVGNTLNLVDKTIDELRSISHNLIPEALNFGLYAALEDICQKINEAGKTQVRIHIAENVQHIELAQQNKLSVYRIVQEVLNNMVKHANASQINVAITKGEANMLIAIRDNGVGFDTAKIDDSKGIGWKNISARVHLLDGDMNIRSEKLLGTQIEISIPA